MYTQRMIPLLSIVLVFVKKRKGGIGYIPATKSTDLFDGPQYTICFLSSPFDSIFLFIALNKHTNLIPILVFPVPKIQYQVDYTNDDLYG